MDKWNQQIEEEITLLLKDWLKQKGKTQKDLRNGLNASSERMPILLETLKKEYTSGGLTRLVALLCAIEESWSYSNQSTQNIQNALDPFNQLDLLLEEINGDCNN